MDQLRRLTRTSDILQDTALCGELLLAGFPDRVARLRAKNRTAYTLFNGRGAKIAESDPLFNAPCIAVAELGGRSSGDGTVFKAARLSETFLLERFAHLITERRRCFFDESSLKVLCRKERLLGAILLSDSPAAPEPGELAQGIFDAALKRGIPLIPVSDKPGRALFERILFAHRREPETFPLLDDSALAEQAWHFFPELKALNQLDRLEWSFPLRSLLGNALFHKLNTLYPEKFVTPAGAAHRIDYSTEEPLLSVKLQEMLGVKLHPVVGFHKIPLKIELLSPAMRPVQTTSDLPGFWQGSYSFVRKEMKARYPKHEWPENPASAPPMLRSVKKQK
jgi:ATP-dependent helicase HrpB